MKLDGDGCMSTGIIQHEFLHSVGLMHAQSRSDRNTYINYFPQNVKCPTNNDNDISCKRHNFKRYTSSQVSHYGLTYDYLSLMHYGRDDFPMEMVMVTLQAKDSFWTPKLGQRDGVSEGDIQLVQRYYGSPG